MGILTYNGKSSSDFGIRIAYRPSREIAEKDYEIVHVPGRNGDIAFFNGSYKNVTRTYNVSFPVTSSFTDQANEITSWLSSANGYVRLEDSYEPDYYRMAIFKDATQIYSALDTAGQMDISFECKPQRFLKSGDNRIGIYTSGVVITNPTNYPSSPLINITGGNGTISFGGKNIIVGTSSSNMIIDCELEDAYINSINLNNKISTPDGYPKLKPGANTIQFTGSIHNISITPRWWII